MNRLRTRVIVMVAATSSAAVAHAANMSDHIESRRLTPIVYVGVVAQDQTVVERGPLSLTAEARIKVLGVAKGPSGKTPAEARLRYSSYDEKTPALDGGPQYRLKKGAYVVAFVSSFDDRPAYLYAGDQGQVRELVQKLRDSLAQMTDAQLKFHEINAAGRTAQLAVYDKALALLGAPAGR